MWSSAITSRGRREYVPQIIDMVARLIERGNAYAGDNGDVYFSVASFAPYGRLSGKRLADLRAGARVEIDESKRDPLDFVLWKAAKPGEPAWESPWGPGRPGWHIECSAMSVALLGPHFDIHGGGMDLKFPHHENEIAQTCAACGSEFVNVWMHNGFVRVDEEKMSKSLGNFFTVREVLDMVRDPEVIRYFMLGSHYRGPINYSLESLAQADAALERLYNALQDVETARRRRRDRRDTSVSRARWTTTSIRRSPSPSCRASRATINTAKASGDRERASAAAGELVALGRRLGMLALASHGVPAQGAEARATHRAREARPHGPGCRARSGRAITDAEIDALIDRRAAARRRRISRSPTASATCSPRRGSCSRIARTVSGTLWRRGR